jgi:hypothetical protein
MTFTHIADASEDGNWDEDEIEEAWEEEEIFDPEDDDEDLWLEVKEDGT